MMHQAHLLNELREIIRWQVADECIQLRALVIIDMVEHNVNKAQPEHIIELSDVALAQLDSRSENCIVPNACDTPFSVDSTNFNFHSNRNLGNNKNEFSIDIAEEAEKNVPSKSKRVGPKLKGSVLMSFDEALDENCQRLQRRRRRASLTVLSASDMNANRNLGVDCESWAKPLSASEGIIHQAVKTNLSPCSLPAHVGENSPSHSPPVCDAMEAAISLDAELICKDPTEETDKIVAVVEDFALVDDILPPQSALEMCAESKMGQPKPARGRRKSVSAGKHAKLKRIVLQSVMESGETEYPCSSAEVDVHYADKERDEVAGFGAEEYQIEPDQLISLDEEQFMNMDICATDCVEVQSSELAAPILQSQPSRRVLYDPSTSGLSIDWGDDDTIPLGQHQSLIKKSSAGSPSGKAEGNPEKATFSTRFAIPLSRCINLMQPPGLQPPMLQSAVGVTIAACFAGLMDVLGSYDDKYFTDFGPVLYSIFDVMSKCSMSVEFQEPSPMIEKSSKRVRFSAVGSTTHTCASPPNDRRPESISSMDSICREAFEFALGLDRFHRIFESGNSQVQRMQSVLADLVNSMASSPVECQAALRLVKKDFPQEVSALQMQTCSSEGDEFFVRRIMSIASVLEAELFGRNSGLDNFNVYIWDELRSNCEIQFRAESRVASEFRHQVSWMATSAIRSRLRWLFDDAPPCYSKPAVTGAIKYENSRSGLDNLLKRSEPVIEIGYPREKQRALKLAVGSVSGTQSTASKRHNDIIYDTPLSYLFSTALRQLYDGIQFAHQEADSQVENQPTGEAQNFRDFFSKRVNGELSSDCLVGKIECAQVSYKGCAILSA